MTRDTQFLSDDKLTPEELAKRMEGRKKRYDAAIQRIKTAEEIDRVGFEIELTEFEQEIINKAKKAVENNYKRVYCGGPGGDHGIDRRKWLELTGEASYKDYSLYPASQLVITYVLSGSPPKGYVVFTRGRNKVIALSLDFKKIKIYDIEWLRHTQDETKM